MHHVDFPMFRYAAQYRVYSIPVGIKDANGMPLDNVVQRHVDQQVRLPCSGFAEAVDMVQPVGWLDAEKLIAVSKVEFGDWCKWF